MRRGRERRHAGGERLHREPLGSRGVRQKKRRARVLGVVRADGGEGGEIHHGDHVGIVAGKAHRRPLRVVVHDDAGKRAEPNQIAPDLRRVRPSRRVRDDLLPRARQHLSADDVPIRSRVRGSPVGAAGSGSRRRAAERKRGQRTLPADPRERPRLRRGVRLDAPVALHVIRREIQHARRVESKRPRMLELITAALHHARVVAVRPRGGPGELERQRAVREDRRGSRPRTVARRTRA